MTAWISTPVVGGPVRVLGAAELEQTADGVVVHRLPAVARAQLPDGFIRMCEEQPSGVRLAFRTAARQVELDVRALRTAIVDRPVPDAGRYDLVVDGVVVGHGSADGHGVIVLDPIAAMTITHTGPVATVVFPVLEAGDKELEIWLPYAEVTRLLAVRTDAPVASATDHASGSVRRPRWVHHGSSISHGASAASPTGIWPVVVARLAGLDLVNLGLSGNAVLDPFIARTIRDQPADLITLKLGINVVNHDCFRRRTFPPAVEGFLDTIREGHPSTPLVVVSPILCAIVEDRPGPTSIDPDSPPDAPVFRTVGRSEELATGKLSLEVIREVLEGVVGRRRTAGDGSMHYLDGRELYGRPEWASMPLPDLLHPTAAGHRHMGEAFAALVPGFLAQS
ncbi:SGNH/GDSL hydrolase family protein [Cellulomonas sp. KRMCY2]|uniref:SGNH/GDSL hydrolase family protein n=1 Tax=Cellulomonas sp. KRMCY2 TaxID=1304865 RepID=UPI00045E9B8E|nr:SGNH/GDSL hydrolase family protein [Cellulomonas sp. KRMCY2]